MIKVIDDENVEFPTYSKALAEIKPFLKSIQDSDLKMLYVLLDENVQQELLEEISEAVFERWGKEIPEEEFFN